jgi:riboflavin synthase
MGRVRSAERQAESVVLWIEVPEDLWRFVAEKGSMTVDGVSLTVNELADRAFRVNLIPFTVKETTLGQLSAGDAVNLEVDQVARYLDRLAGVIVGVEDRWSP